MAHCWLGHVDGAKFGLGGKLVVEVGNVEENRMARSFKAELFNDSVVNEVDVDLGALTIYSNKISKS